MTTYAIAYERLTIPPYTGFLHRRTKVDTIFLVTDGTPTTGEIVDVRKLVIAINEVNRTRGIVIHLICFDKDAINRLKPLAEQSGGQAVLRGF